MASESLICLRSGRLPAASVFQVSVLSAFPAPGVGCISGFRPCLFLRFPTLPAPPVPGLACSSGFRCWLLLRFSSCPSLRFSAYLLLRFPVLSASSVFVLSVSAGFQPYLLLRLPALAVFFGSWICPALRLDALLRQLSVSSPSALRQLSVSFPSAFRHTTGGAAAQSRKPSFTNCSRMRVQSATGRFTPSTNRIGQPRLLSSM